jgi:hypothetical protein
MEVDLIPILSTIILATTIVTIVLAVGSYAAYKLRDKQRAGPAQGRRYRGGRAAAPLPTLRAATFTAALA